MTILVTGGAGYIGSHMVHALVDAGESVVVLDNLSTGFEWAMPKGVTLVVGDTGNQAAVTKLMNDHNITEVIHFDRGAGLGGRSARLLSKQYRQFTRTDGMRGQGRH